MKRLSVLSLILMLAFVSCSKEAEVVNTQNLTGMIDGIEFDAKSGTVVELFDDRLSFEIYNENVGGLDPCGLLTQDIHIYFTCEKSTDRQELFLDFTTFEGFTVTLSNPEGDKKIATQGFIELKSIEDDLVELTMDVQFDDDNFAKGEFAATVCN